jgi:hypothetical protein
MQTAMAVHVIINMAYKYNFHCIFYVQIRIISDKNFESYIRAYMQIPRSWCPATGFPSSENSLKVTNIIYETSSWMCHYERRNLLLFTSEIAVMPFTFKNIAVSYVYRWERNTWRIYFSFRKNN